MAIFYLRPKKMCVSDFTLSKNREGQDEKAFFILDIFANCYWTVL